jgi:glutathione S-transferase|nr:glutathione S-transferase family protein [Kofleriaceae bacterium]
MTLTLHYHPLSSFCWKALIGLYEADVPFTPHLVDLSDAAARAAFAALWPLAKFPVLRDDAAGLTLPESSILLEYAAPRLIPRDPAAALACRLRDRLYDHYIHAPMQAIVGDRLRPPGARDPHGVAAARARIATAYAEAEPHAATAGRGELTLADCAAFPALHYASALVPLAGHPQLAAYLDRLRARPSVARVLREAEPYLHLVPTA